MRRPSIGRLQSQAHTSATLAAQATNRQIVSLSWTRVLVLEVWGLIVIAGNILTVDPQRPTAEALAVTDGRVVAIGSRADVQPWIGPVLGGTVVTITGARLADVDALVCSFGSSSVAASAHSSGGVRCVSPESNAGSVWTSLVLSSHGTALRSGSSFFARALL